MENYHRHSCFSNLFTPDSATLNEEYAKRAVELGHKTIPSVEHGWQGYYFQTYELAKKYGLKPVIGAEAYWVKDRLAEFKTIDEKGKEHNTKDRSNHHIIMLAKSNQGREAINDILSEASITGYYYKPRVDIPLLLSLPPKDVMITSACIAFNGYEDIDNIILQLNDHFQENFYLEVQYHNTDKQKEWNKHLVGLSKKYNIPLIAGMDSHFIVEEDSKLRDYILEAKNIHYEDEDGWYMDYPDAKTSAKRFLEQDVLTKEQIKEAINNTNVTRDFCDYDNVYIFTKDIKLPTLYPNLTKEEKDKKYSKLITQKFKEYMKNIPESEYERYFQGIKDEVQVYKDTGMCDYPLLDYAIVKDAVEHGGIITDSGRGSAVSFMTNTLLGFSKVDRFKADIKLYPERFISTTRILETKSLPDIDLNVGTVEIFEEAQKRILGEEHVAPMVAFGTLRKKSAFKLYARAKNMDFDLANEISDQISKYDEAVKNAEEDEEIDIYEYVDEKYRDYIERSEEYWGVIMDKKKAPSAYLLYQGNIRKEIGLMKCKSETTGKEVITCVIDGAIAENYKFLKNDILKVDSALLISKVFERIGIEHFGVNELVDKLKNDEATWDIYKKGYTIGINQVEQSGTKHKCMRYSPKNLSELSAFVAAVRPGFKSMYSKFEKREDFSWGIPSLDNLLKTEQLPVSFLFFQEQVMAVLNYAGFPMDVCYGAIKAIAKKHPEKVLPLKEKFIVGFKERLIKDEGLTEDIAQNNAEQVWTIVNDNCGYGFNSSHAYCMALDSAYQAWQKAHYPYEFYEVLLNHFSDKGKKDKVAELKVEMKKAFGISEGAYSFSNDNRRFVAVPEEHQINPALVSVKGLSQSLADKLYLLNRKNKFESFIDLLLALKKKSICNSAQLDILIKLDYFKDFGKINELLMQVELFNKYYDRKEFNKSELNIPSYLLEKHCTKETEKKYCFEDTLPLIKDLCENVEPSKTTTLVKMRYQYEYLGYVQYTNADVDENYCFVQEIEKNITTLYKIQNGDILKIKFRKKDMQRNEFKQGSMIKILAIRPEGRYAKDENGDWYQREDAFEDILKEWLVLKE